MSLIADGVLIFACLTTAIYCFVLSRRLRSLSGTEEGLGLQIRQMNAALDETRSSVKEIRGSAKAATDRLTREIAQAKRTADRLKQVLAEAEARSAAVKKRFAASDSRPERESEGPADSDDALIDNLPSEDGDEAAAAGMVTLQNEDLELLGDISESALTDLDLNTDSDETADPPADDEDIAALLEDAQDEAIEAGDADPEDELLEAGDQGSEKLLRVERVAI
jgi:hypothetical protein